MIPGSITVVLETILGCVASDPSIDVPMTCIDLDKWFTATHEDFRQRDGHSTEYNTLENLHTYYGAVIRRDHVTAAIRHLSGEIESIRKSAEDARIFAEDARLAAGQAGENSLISFFDKHSSEAGWKATGLACASVLALGLAMLVGWLVIRSAHELSTGMILGRLSLTLPSLPLLLTQVNSRAFSRLGAMGGDCQGATAINQCVCGNYRRCHISR